MTALEAEFNCSLLLRDSHGVRPTQTGIRLYRHAQIVLQRVEDTKAAVVAESEVPRGTVTFGMPPSHVTQLALPLFNAVRQRYPAVTLRICEERSALIANRVRTGQFELGLVFAEQHDASDLSLSPILEEQLFALTSPTSSLARRKSLRLKELQDMELILPSADHGVRQSLERAMNRAGGKISHVHEETSFNLMKLGAAAGLGVTILSWASAEAEIKAGTLIPIEIVGPHVMLNSALCHLPQVMHGEACECIKTIVREVVFAGAEGGSWKGSRPILCGEVTQVQKTA